MYVYKVVVGVELINELLRKSGEGGGGDGLYIPDLSFYVFNS